MLQNNLDARNSARHTALSGREKSPSPARCATAGEKPLQPGKRSCETAQMATHRLPFPVPDERAHLFVDSYADMHDLVEDLVVPADVPEAAATVMRTARELLRQSYYCYEFSTVAVMHSLIAVEIVLRDRIPDADKKPLRGLIKQGSADGMRSSPSSARRPPGDHGSVTALGGVSHRRLSPHL
jgi:hypothetical protein